MRIVWPHRTALARVPTPLERLAPQKIAVNFSVNDEMADGMNVQTVVVDGADAAGLLRAADDVDASLIVVGSHGSGGSADPFLGSTSHRTVADSHRPVVVVPPAAEHEHGRHDRRVPD